MKEAIIKKTKENFANHLSSDVIKASVKLWSAKVSKDLSLYAFIIKEIYHHLSSLSSFAIIKTYSKITS